MADQAMIIPEGYVQARRLVEDGSRLVFVSGNAGTGKTTLIRYLQENISLRHVVLAPTGVAALNAGGATIHSFFRFPPRIQDPDHLRIPDDRRIYQKLELIIIDEASMLRADMLDSIDAFLRACNDDYSPFGGVRILLLGDMFQLPPVVIAGRTGGARRARIRDSLLLQRRVPAGPGHRPRRTGRDIPPDRPGVRLAAQPRPRGRGHPGGHQPPQRVLRRAGRRPRHHPHLHQRRGGCHQRRPAADARRPRSALFLGETEGKFGLDGDRLPSPLELRLKPGARVMFTKNDDEGRWVNGTLGTVTWLSGGRIEVDIDGAGIHEVPRTTWQSYKYRLDRDSDRIVADEVGHYTQYPLMLAWAVTIHKSQGKTLDRVMVDFGSGAFAPGQAYVALSRCRSLEGLRLARPLRASDVRCDPRIRGFHQALRGGDTGEAGEC